MIEIFHERKKTDMKELACYSVDLATKSNDKECKSRQRVTKLYLII